MAAIDAASGTVLWTDPGTSAVLRLPGGIVALDAFVQNYLYYGLPYQTYTNSDPVLAPDGSVVIPRPATGDERAPSQPEVVCWDQAEAKIRWTAHLPVTASHIEVVTFHAGSVLLSVDGYLKAFRLADGSATPIGAAASVPLSAIGLTTNRQFDARATAQFGDLLIGPTGAIRLAS